MLKNFNKSEKSKKILIQILNKIYLFYAPKRSEKRGLKKKIKKYIYHFVNDWL